MSIFIYTASIKNKHKIIKMFESSASNFYTVTGLNVYGQYLFQFLIVNFAIFDR